MGSRPVNLTFRFFLLTQNRISVFVENNITILASVPGADAKRRRTMTSGNLPKLSMYIGGEWTAPASGEYLETVDPFTARPWALVPRGNAEDADLAVRAAHEAFTNGPWR